MAAGDNVLDVARQHLATAYDHSGNPEESERQEAHTDATCAIGLVLCDIAESLRIIAGRTP